VNDIIETAIGGKTIATTVEGRERYPISVRYARDFRDDLDSLKRVLVATPTAQAAAKQAPPGAPSRMGNAAAPDTATPQVPPSRSLQISTTNRPAFDPERERPARRFRLRGYRGQRHRRLRPHRSQRINGAREVSRGLL